MVNNSRLVFSSPEISDILCVSPRPNPTSYSKGTRCDFPWDKAATVWDWLLLYTYFRGWEVRGAIPVQPCMPTSHAQGRPYPSLLGAFVKLRKATVSFLMSICPSVRLYNPPSDLSWKKLGSHWTDFHEIWYFSIFRKSVKKIQLSLKSDRYNGYFTWRQIYIFIISCSILLIMRDVTDKSFTHFMFNNFSSKNLTVYKVMWKYIVQSDRPLVTV